MQEQGRVRSDIGRTDWVQLFFSSSGRAGRTPFLMAVAILVAILAFYDAAIGGVTRMLTGWLVLGALAFSGLCVTAKRMHDRGRSGWWAGPVVLAFAIVWPGPDGDFGGFFDFLWALVLIWAAVELGAMAGEQGANRYGPPPVTPAAARGERDQT